MRKLILSLVLIFALSLSANAQLAGGRPLSYEETAISFLKSDLITVPNVTDEQFDELLKIYYEIDKEIPTTNRYFPTFKERLKVIPKVYELRLKLYPKVLDEEQMEIYTKSTLEGIEYMKMKAEEEEGGKKKKKEKKEKSTN